MSIKGEQIQKKVKQARKKRWWDHRGKNKGRKEKEESRG